MESQIANTLKRVVASCDADLEQKQHADLEGYWHFKWDDAAPLERNLYQFHKMLTLYGNFCRRWEEKHNGSCCVVERVRDTYLMPKLKELAARLQVRPIMQGEQS